MGALYHKLQDRVNIWKVRWDHLLRYAMAEHYSAICVYLHICVCQGIHQVWNWFENVQWKRSVAGLQADRHKGPTTAWNCAPKPETTGPRLGSPFMVKWEALFCPVLRLKSFCRSDIDWRITVTEPLEYEGNSSEFESFLATFTSRWPTTGWIEKKTYIASK